MPPRLHLRSRARKSPDIAQEPTSSTRQIKSERYVTLLVDFQGTCAEIHNEKTRVEDEKVIYRPSPAQPLRLEVLEVIDAEPEDIAYWLRYRGSKERYYDGNRGVFVGEELEDDPSVTA